MSGCLFVHCWVAEQLLSTTDCSLVLGRGMLDKRSKQRRRVEQQQDRGSLVELKSGLESMHLSETS